MTIDLLWRLRNLFGYALVLLLCAWFWWGKNSLETEVAELKLELGTAYATIETQNHMIGIAEIKTKRAQKIGEEALKAAKTADRGYQKKAQRILVEVPVADDECVAALELLKEYQR